MLPPREDLERIECDPMNPQHLPQIKNMVLKWCLAAFLWIQTFSGKIYQSQMSFFHLGVLITAKHSSMNPQKPPYDEQKD